MKHLSILSPVLAISLAAQTARTATITVNTLADNGPGSLRAALASVSSGDAINFSVSGTILLTSGELLVNQNVAIVGPGPSNLAVDGNEGSRVFHVGSNSVVSLSGLTITNGLASGSVFPNYAGGGILSDHAVLSVSNCILSGNMAGFGLGGGIYNDGSGGGNAKLTVVSSTFSGNSGQGGGIYNAYASLTVSNCLLRGNTASKPGFAGGAGGAIYNSGETGSATMTIVNSLLSSNSVLGSFNDGGAIFNSGGIGSATLAVRNCTLNGNSAGVGGGIWNGASSGTATVTIVNTILSDNSASNDGGGINNVGFSGGSVTLILNNCILNGNSAYTGGGIDNSAAAVTISNSTFSENSANLGGGIANYGTLAIASSTLRDNSASNVGGGVGNLSTLTILNSTISSNSASSDGGGVFNNGNVSIANSTFSGNTAPKGGGVDNDPFGINGHIDIGSTILNAGASGENILNNTGVVRSRGYNLSSDSGGGFLTTGGDQINTDPMLGPLQDNGGPTFTHALLCGSPAIDAGANLSGATIDQRGFARTFDDPRIPNAAGGDGTDIGAYEVQSGDCLTPAQKITELVSLLESFGLNKGTEKNFLSKLESADRWLAKGNVPAACDSLGEFLNEVTGHKGKKLTAAQADSLIAMATDIRMALGCQ